MTLFALLFPLGLFVTTTDLPDASHIGRMLIAASVAPGLARVLVDRLGGTERKYLAVLLLMAIGIGASVLAIRASLPLEPDVAIEVSTDLQRQAFLLAVSGLLALAFRGRRLRVWVSAGIGVFALVASVELVRAWFSFARATGAWGLSHGAQFKFWADAQLGYAVNPAAAVVALAALVALPVWWKSPLLRVVLVSAAGAAIAVSGSRSTQISVIAGLALWVLLSSLATLRGPGRWALATIAAGAFATAATLAVMSQATDLNEVTTGRAQLWRAAIARFEARPVAGWGAGSWRTDLAQHGEAPQLTAGGYHNSYLALLAERGLLGFVPGLVLLLVLFRWSLRASSAAPELDGHDARLARLAPVLIAVIALRSLGENAGLLGTAAGIVDFLAHAAAALVVGLATDLEAAQPAEAAEVAEAPEPAVATELPAGTVLH